jgi:hypothetical protein
MPYLKLVAAAMFFALAIAPCAANGIRHHHHRHINHYGLPYEISYNHNYGPGALPGTFAYYDGPSNNACWQGSANYRGQDNRRYPCF